MILSISPPPAFCVCATKVFAQNELHITRVSSRSVLILMTEGVLRFREAGKEVDLCAGEYYIQPEGLLQEGLPNPVPPVYFFIEFHGSFCETGHGLPLRGSFQKRNILPLLGQMEALFQSHHGNPFQFHAYMNRVFSELWMQNVGHDDGSHVVGLIRNDIDARYAETVSADELSRRFGYDADHITRIFKKQYGITPHQYRIRLRMEHAKWLLDNTALSVEAVAENVGYRDFSAFYRAYKKAFGVSPRQGKLSSER